MINTESSSTIELVRSRLMRVNVHFKDKKLSTGTLIPISKRKGITCIHVLLGCGTMDELCRKLQIPRNKLGHSNVLKHLQSIVREIKIQNKKGKNHSIKNIQLYPNIDVAIITFTADIVPLKITEDKKIPSIGTTLWCFGYPDTVGVPSAKSPFTMQIGHIRSLPSLRLTATKAYPHISIDALCLPGMSGGPVINPLSGEVIGQIQGYNSWGSERVMFSKKEKGEKETMFSDSMYIPLPITYVIPISKIQVLMKKHRLR